MDSLPFEFYFDVLSHITSRRKIDLKAFQELPPFSHSSQILLKKQEIFQVWFNSFEGHIGASLVVRSKNRLSGDVVKEGRAALKLLHSMNKATSRVDLVHFRKRKNDKYKNKELFSFEQLARWLGPILTAQSSSDICLIAPSSVESVSIYNSMRVVKAHLNYCGEQSEKFLKLQVDNGWIHELNLCGEWPQSMYTHILKFLNSSNFKKYNGSFKEGISLGVEAVDITTRRWANGDFDNVPFFYVGGQFSCGTVQYAHETPLALLCSERKASLTRAGRILDVTLDRTHCYMFPKPLRKRKVTC